MSANWTPGPWETVGATRIWRTGESGGAVAIIAEPECEDSSDFRQVEIHSKRWKEAMANAKLIAAAPDLAEQLRRLVFAIENESDRCIACGRGDSLHRDSCPVASARAALAAAGVEE